MTTDDEKCKCGEPSTTESHSCPYAEDVGNNPDPEYCTCCDDCAAQYLSLMDI